MRGIFAILILLVMLIAATASIFLMLHLLGLIG